MKKTTEYSQDFKNYSKMSDYEKFGHRQVKFDSNQGVNQHPIQHEQVTYGST